MDQTEPIAITLANHQDLERMLQNSVEQFSGRNYSTDFCCMTNSACAIAVSFFKKGRLVFDSGGITTAIDKQTNVEQGDFFPYADRVKYKTNSRKPSQSFISWLTIENEPVSIIWMPKRYSFRKVMNHYLPPAITKLGAEYEKYDPTFVADILDQIYGPAEVPDIRKF